MLPAVLVSIAAIADAHAAHHFALDALLAAVPFTAVAAIAAFGGYLDRRDDAVVALQAASAKLGLPRPTLEAQSR